MRVPDDQAPFVFVSGKQGGWFVSLLWHYGTALDVHWRDLRRLLANSKGDVFIGRRLTGDELTFLETYRRDIDQEVHARLFYKQPMRWLSPRKR